MQTTRRLPLLLLLGLAACSGGGNGTPATPQTGSATLAFTDAAADEVDLFEVDVKSVVLHRSSGSDVSVLTRKARVDFAELESLTEIIVGAAIPTGTYTGMTMTLDFSTATVCIVGQTSPATIVDQNGNILTGDSVVQITFPTAARPRIGTTRNHLFLLDLDLDQALVVDAGNNLVMFVPTVTASVDGLNLKPIMMTGVLTATNAGGFTVDRRTPDGTSIGTYAVATTATTVYQIDGVTSVGDAGLQALAAQLSVPPRVWVQGTLDFNQQLLTAVAVETGAGTPGNGQDWVLGHIVARDLGAGGNARLTVLGQSFDDPSGTRRFNTLHQVDVDVNATKVLRRGAGNSLTTDALNVGQRVFAFGTLTGTTLDATASTGVVRLLLTSVFGIANSAPTTTTLPLALTRIGLLPIGQFSFTVGGNSQSTPTAYNVNVTGLNTASLTTGSKVRAIGWVNPVDVNGDDDLTTITLVDHSSLANVLLCQWLPPRADALPSINNSSISIDVSNALLKVVGDGFSPTTLTTNPTPRLQPLIGAGLFAIFEGTSLEFHDEFRDFATSLASRVSATSPVFRVTSLGVFDDATQTFRATVVSVILQ